MHANPGLMCLGGVCADKNTYPSAAALRLHGSHGTSAPASSALMMRRLSSCAFLRRTSPSQAQRRTTYSPACPSAVFIYRGLDPTGPVPERTHIYRREPPAYPATTPTPGLNAEPPTAPLILPLCTCSGYSPASGPVPGNAKSAILCHEYNGALTLILTGYLPSCPDIPEAQEAPCVFSYSKLQNNKE